MMQQEEISAFDERRLAPNSNQLEPLHPVTPKLLDAQEDRCRPIADMIISRHSANEELATSIQIGVSEPQKSGEVTNNTRTTWNSIPKSWKAASLQLPETRYLYRS